MNLPFKSFKNKIFEFNAHTLAFAVLFLLNVFTVAAQETTVTGTVTDTNRTPLAGVSVNVKGSSRGTSTNSSGKFTIPASPDATLVFSSVGYTNQEVPVGAR